MGGKQKAKFRIGLPILRRKYLVKVEHNFVAV
jgi:hypothetical protein